jgi:hypothetical protein
MADHQPTRGSPHHREDIREDARRWVRRVRIVYTMVGVYLALSGMWFAIDMADGTEDLWFYWPMIFTGVSVFVVAVILLGTGRAFGLDWERRQIDWYVERHGLDAPERGVNQQPRSEQDET